MSPQLLMEEPYSSKCDVWSLAMIFYEMIFGKTPWTGKSPYQLYKNICDKPLEFSEDIPVGEQTKDLLQKMLTVEDEKRITWADVFAHPLVNIPFE